MANEKPLVLIVDDTPANLSVLTHLLLEHYRVKVATSGAKALALASQEPPDIVLLDVMMPGMDGYEVCRRLKADPLTAEIPLLFVTARIDSADEERGFAEGAVDFIHKPISPPIVLARVKTHLMLKAQADRLRQMAFIDGLTGIANRRYFDETLDRAWRQAQRDEQPLGLLLIDIDCFKQFNDHYGHQEGDVCLQAVASALKACLNRPQDHVARYGGEEFVCLLANTAWATSCQKAEEMLAAVRDLRRAHAFSPVAETVTISVGLISGIPAQTDSAAAFIHAADTCLYEAKRQGRNRFFGAQWALLPSPS